VLSTRNFDPTTRTLRKRGVDDGENEDTVEKAVEGVAERVLTEDEERQAQDLVSDLPYL
jgi:coiled-coil domain-containing protein 12